MRIVQRAPEVVTADLARAGVSKIWNPKVEPSGATALAALITSALEAYTMPEDGDSRFLKDYIDA